MTSQKRSLYSPPDASTREVACVPRMQITRPLAEKVLATIDLGLGFGLGGSEPGDLCVEAAVCHALGLPPGDDPGGVLEPLRRLQIRLNDAAWSSRTARARGLRRLGLAQLDSDQIDEHQFAARVMRLAITQQLPIALRAVASVHKDPLHQEALTQAAEQCEREGERRACRAARAAADAANALQGFHAAAAACAAGRCALSAISALAADSRASDRAASAALCAICAAHARAIAATAVSGIADRAVNGVFDESLSRFAEDVVEVLVEMKAPGCQWLELTEAA